MAVGVARLLASSAGLVVFCLSADHVIFAWEDRWKRLPHGAILRAIADNVAHGLVGGWCWANAILLMVGGGGEAMSWTRLVQVAVCMLTASAIDLDHFVEARSLSFQDALSLQKRTFAHNTSLVLVGTVLLYLATTFLLPTLHLDSSFTRDLPAMFFISTLSHHLRDADRRGIWLAPFPSTPPIPYKLYPILIISLPFLAFAPRMFPVVLRGLVEGPRALTRAKRSQHPALATVV